MKGSIDMTWVPISLTMGLFILCGAICCLWQRNKPRHPGNLLIAIGLIAVSYLNAKSMMDLGAFFELLEKHYELGTKEAALAKASTTLWAGVASLVIGGVGVNLLSSWIDS